LVDDLNAPRPGQAKAAAELEKLAERARSEQHEILLQVLMEPFD